jgi:hypothetical protein
MNTGSSTKVKKIPNSWHTYVVAQNLGFAYSEKILFCNTYL